MAHKRHKRGCKHFKGYLDPTCPLCASRIERGFKSGTTPRHLASKSLQREAARTLQQGRDIMEFCSGLDRRV